jgi:hypothetical protein
MLDNFCADVMYRIENDEQLAGERRSVLWKGR